jgi:hypothetical protein
MIKLEFTVEQINVLLNILNTPQNAQTINLASFIQMIQDQAGPQVAELQKEEEAKKEEEPNEQ